MTYQLCTHTLHSPDDHTLQTHTPYVLATDMSLTGWPPAHWHQGQSGDDGQPSRSGWSSSGGCRHHNPTDPSAILRPSHQGSIDEFEFTVCP